MLLYQAGPPLQDGSDGLAVTVLDGHRDQVRGPVRPGPLRLDHGLHADIDDTALERLYQVIQVIDFAFREDDEHLPCPLHQLDRVALRLFVLASALHGKGAEALEPPAGDPVAFVERLAVHHVEESAVAAAGEFQASLEVRLIGVVGGEDEARPLGQIPQDLQVARFNTQPIPPGQFESEVVPDGPDHPPPRLRGSTESMGEHAVRWEPPCQISPASCRRAGVLIAAPCTPG